MPDESRLRLLSKIASVDEKSFDETALEVFRFQAERNALFKKWLKMLGRNPLKINELREIPCLPIAFFKTHLVKTGRWPNQIFFTSSGTTGQRPSRHSVRDLDFYLQNTERGWAHYFEKIENWTVLALLPSYLERSGSSLVAMADHWIKKSKKTESGFFLNDLDRLAATIEKLQNEGRPTVLIGVSFALLDLAERFAGADFSKIKVVETGGMKGRRRELTRSELHEILRNSLKINDLSSEYGMTELFSQGYFDAETGVFRPAPTLKIFSKEINDPFAEQVFGKNGQLSAIDLANIDTCSFVATEDVGRVFDDGSFEVLGRLDAAEMRGCNLLVE